MKNFKLKILMTVMLLTPSMVFATNGYFAHGWGMKAKAMGGAGIANAEDALVAANNPAGMVHIGNRFDFGLDLFVPDRGATITGNGGGGNQSADGNGDATFLIPEFGYNHMINDTMSFGVSVYGNGGLNATYENGILLFNGGAGETSSNILQLFVAPTFAMKINQDHSFGVSFNLAYQTVEINGIQNFCNGAFSSNPGSCTNQGVDSSTGYGFSVGYLGQLSPNFSVGLSYRSETDMGKFDKYSGLFAEQGGFNIPAMYGAGLKFTPSSSVTILFDYTHISYSDIASISNPLSNLTVSGNLLGTNNGGGFGWQDMDIYKLGIAWEMSKNLTLRAGWNHGDQPIPASETLFNIIAPATVEDHLTLGGTWTLSNGSELTVAYLHAFENSVSGSGSIPAAFGSGEASLSMEQNSLGIAYGWTF